VLWRYCAAVEDVGGRLLGPTPEYVARTTDKFVLCERWRAAQVRAPMVSLRVAEMTGTFDYPLVLKPVDGAGSQATFLVQRPNELPESVQAARTEGFEGSLMVTVYVSGLPVSVAFLAGPACLLELPVARQYLTQDGRFRYLGGTVPLFPSRSGRAARLAREAVRTVPGLFGYVGVDLVLGEAADGSQDYAIEVNPRLTTSYLGYRRLSTTNLAGAMLTVCQGGTPALQWRPGPVHFAPTEIESA
jgi:predicted ATP-grasp superfamily ATP-dependent carboligase